MTVEIAQVNVELCESEVCHFLQKINTLPRASKLTTVNYSDSVEEWMSCLFTTFSYTTHQKQMHANTQDTHTQPDSNEVRTTLCKVYLYATTVSDRNCFSVRVSDRNDNSVGTVDDS